MRFSIVAILFTTLAMSACATHQSAVNTPANNMPTASAGDWPVASAQGQEGCVLLDTYFLAKYSKEYIIWEETVYHSVNDRRVCREDTPVNSAPRKAGCIEDKTRCIDFDKSRLVGTRAGNCPATDTFCP